MEGRPELKAVTREGLRKSRPNDSTREHSLLLREKETWAKDAAHAVFKGSKGEGPRGPQW